MSAQAGPRVNQNGHECWLVETSRDGEHWRFFGRAWKRPGESLLLHAVPRWVRFRPADEGEWRAPIAQTAELPMTLLDMETGIRRELWPEERHVGFPMLLPGGEAGRLLSFEHQVDPARWTYTLEFRGARE